MLTVLAESYDKAELSTAVTAEFSLSSHIRASSGLVIEVVKEYKRGNLMTNNK